MVHVAWLGKKSPFCGNVSYGNLTTEQLKLRGHKVSFIHFDNPSSSNESKPLFLANDPDVSLPYLIKSQVYTIPSPRAEKELRLSLDRLKPVQRDRSWQKLGKALQRTGDKKYAPILCDMDGCIVNGHHRYDALRLRGQKEARVHMINGRLKEIMQLMKR